MKHTFYLSLNLILLCFYGFFFHDSLFAQTHFTQPVVNEYSSIISLLNKNPDDPDTIEVADPGYFNPGDHVLFIVMKGAEIYTPYDYPDIPGFWGNISSINNTGIYSIHLVEEVTGNLVILATPLRSMKPFRNGERAQLITVPVVQTACLDTIITCKPWDRETGTGGVLAIIATRKILLNKGIDVTAMGFLGADPGNDYFKGNCGSSDNPFCTGAAHDSAGLKGEGIIYEGFPFIRGFSYAANAGGGGNGKYSGGGGGGSHGPGGWAGYESELCSPSVNRGGKGRHISPGFYSNEGSFSNRIFMGGGGGSSTQNPDSLRFATPGANGGGIVILITDTLETITRDTIFARGGSVPDTATAGGGGGGGGGTVVLDVGKYMGNIHINVRGGDGGLTNSMKKTGPGGFGGGGFIWFSGNELPANITVDTANGKSGFHIPSYSAYGSITSSTLAGNMLGNLISPFVGTLINKLDDKYIYCTEEVTGQLPGSAPKGGTGEYTYRWEQSEDTKSWNSADGNDSSRNYMPVAVFDTMYFRRIVQSGTITDTSNSILVVQLSPINDNLIKGGGSVCENQLPEPLVQGDLPVTGGSGFYVYFWEILQGETFVPAPGINYLPEYTPPPLFENSIFKRKVWSDICYSPSNEVEFIIRKPPAVIKSPAGDTIISGDGTSFSILAAGSEPLNYHWMHNDRNIEGFEGNELLINNANTQNTGYYYCIIDNDCGMVSTDSAYLLVTPAVSVPGPENQSGLPVVYPNPSGKTVFIDHAYQGQNCISVYNLYGTLIKKILNSSVIELDDSGDGLYYIKIEYPEKPAVFLRTLIKIR